MTTTDNGLEAFLSRAFCRKYPAKATIISATNDTGEHRKIHYILEGSVEVFTNNDKGNELILAYVNKGEFFGELQFFLQNTAFCKAHVVARTDCKTASLPHTVVLSIAKKHPQFLFDLAQQTAKRLAHINEKIERFAFGGITGRVAGELLKLANQPDAITHPEGMQVRITRVEIGRLVGCGRETASRAMSDLDSAGLISISGKTVVIKGEIRQKNETVERRVFTELEAV